MAEQQNMEDPLTYLLRQLQSLFMPGQAQAADGQQNTTDVQKSPQPAQIDLSMMPGQPYPASPPGYTTETVQAQQVPTGSTPSLGEIFGDHFNTFQQPPVPSRGERVPMPSPGARGEGGRGASGQQAQPQPGGQIPGPAGNPAFQNLPETLGMLLIQAASSPQMPSPGPARMSDDALFKGEQSTSQRQSAKRKKEKRDGRA